MRSLFGNQNVPDDSLAKNGRVPATTGPAEFRSHGSDLCEGVSKPHVHVTRARWHRRDGHRLL